MKFYKVNPEKLFGKVFGNSTMKTQSSSPIIREEYIKVNVDGKVWNYFDKPVFINQHARLSPRKQLVLTEKDLNEFFIECEDPGPKTISNIRFVVGKVDYENFNEVKSFDNVEDAVRSCQNFIDTDWGECYEVRVEYDVEWKK